MKSHTIKVSIVYALPEQTWLKSMVLNRGATPEDLMQKSGLFDAFPALLQAYEKQELNFGIYAQRVDDHYLLEEGDRLEIYRSLTADPKVVRRELAAQGKTMSGRGID